MINIVILEGRLTKDVELQKTGTGRSLARFTIATDEGKGKDGIKISNFPNCEAWGQPAEFLAQYAHKGDLVSVQGRVRTGSYDDNGTTRYFTTITADRVNLLGSKKNAENEPKQPNTTEYDEDNLPW